MTHPQVTFRITLRDGSLKDIQASNDSWFSMLGFHNYGLMYTNGKSPVRIFYADGIVRQTYTNASGYEVKE